MEIFHTERWKIFPSSFSGLSQTPENIIILLENDFPENIFQKRRFFCKQTELKKIFNFRSIVYVRILRDLLVY